mmetsp:Transcript_7559/g.22414  ORF Transcript_7559/g.22414 Transcript_7559/m.22414 type:complete len:546 (+) Transcript_7559:197-1834(+)
MRLRRCASALIAIAFISRLAAFAPRRLLGHRTRAPLSMAASEGARDLKKALRRLKHAGGAPAAEVAALEKRIAEKEAHEKELASVKGGITVCTKRLRACGDAERADLEAERDRLQARYGELTGGGAWEGKRKRPKPDGSLPPGNDPLAPPPGPETFPAKAENPHFRFEVVHESAVSRARVGRIHTPHGVIETPCFVPVGTNAALKAVSAQEAAAAGVDLMFCNTYHLLVHPGADVVANAGGLHAFMGRDRPLITDSGGFQVFSLAEPDSDDDRPELKQKRARRKPGDDPTTEHGSLKSVDERGVVFKSYRDGTEIVLTPESSVGAQKRLGADIIIPLDELPPYHVTRERLEASVQLSHRWMARSLRAHLADPRRQAMYAVVHGGVDRELRERSAAYLASLPFDGMAVGGSLGKDRAEMLDMLSWLMPLLPRDRPNHLLGIADPESCEAVVPLGVDTMDSCNPTRVARHGTLLTTQGVVRIKAQRYRDDHGPIDPGCPSVPQSRAYLHHLFKANEPLALTVASLHNIYYMNHLMREMRGKIMRDEI